MECKLLLIDDSQDEIWYYSNASNSSSNQHANDPLYSAENSQSKTMRNKLNKFSHKSL